MPKEGVRELDVCCALSTTTFRLSQLSSTFVDTRRPANIPKAALESKLHEATRLARQRLVKNGAQAGEKRRDIGGRAGERTFQRRG
jgi:hypothetical protein